MLVFCVLLFCRSFIARYLTLWGFLPCMCGCCFPSCKIIAVRVRFRPSIRIFMPKWRCMLTGRCCHLVGLRRLSFIVRPSCRGKLDWFLASAHCVVCGNLRQCPFTVSISPCDWNGGAWNLIFIFIGRHFLGSRFSFFFGTALISLFITGAHDVFSLSLFTEFLSSSSIRCTAKWHYEWTHCPFFWHTQRRLFRVWFPNFRTRKACCTRFK